MYHLVDILLVCPYEQCLFIWILYRLGIVCHFAASGVASITFLHECIELARGNRKKCAKPIIMWLTSYSSLTTCAVLAGVCALMSRLQILTTCWLHEGFSSAHSYWALNWAFPVNLDFFQPHEKKQKFSAFVWLGDMRVTCQGVNVSTSGDLAKPFPLWELSLSVSARAGYGANQGQIVVGSRILCHVANPAAG